ncbi:MAG TPA: hypothetical protein VLJ21_01135 [Candidatus Binatia bacterium]|nr:hypothetical protein [Candidatus Binatia bacterium]
MAETHSYWENQRGETIVGSADVLFWITVIIHVLDAVFGRLSKGGVTIPGGTGFFLLAYAAIAIYASWGVFKDEMTEHRLARLGKYLIISAIAYFLPVLVNGVLARGVGQTTLYVIGSTLIFAPTWIVYLGLFERDHLGKGSRGFLVLYELIWIAALFLLILPYAKTATVTVAGESGAPAQISVQEAFLNVYEKTLLNYQKLTGTVVNTTQSQIGYATGDAFTARVDRNAKEKLGVKMDSLQMTQPIFGVNDPVGVFTKLTAETIDLPLAIGVGCNATDSKTNPVSPRSVSPAGVVDVAQQEVIDIDCDFNSGAFTPGTGTVHIMADFSTATLAYLKTYFMTRDRLRELRTAKIDPFQQYGITDRNPATIYTNGPVSVAMGFSAPPVGIDTTVDEFTGTLGMTIKNVWQGKIKALLAVYVLVPKGFTVTEITGTTGTFKQTHCIDLQEKDWCDDALANVYELTSPGGFTQAIDAQQSITLRMRLRATAADYERILGTTPISTKFFKAVAAYVYSLDQARSFSVVGGANSSGSTASEKVLLLGSPTAETTGTTANITFVTNVASATEVQYCAGSNTVSCKRLISSAPASSTTHSHLLQGLQPSTLYSYDLYGFSSACPNNKCPLSVAGQSGSFNFVTGSP